MKHLAILTILLCTSAQAATIQIPQDYPKIQDAINQASEGDTLLVQPGEYEENINFRGKNIVLTSLDPNDPNTVANTVIYRTAAYNPRGKTYDTSGNGSIITFSSGETADAVLTGFTIRGGYGTNLSSTFWYGAGIFCLNANPTITHNVIALNMGPIGLQEGQPIGYGGGICCAASGAFVAYNVFADNMAAAGGGILALEDNSVFYNNLIKDNSASVGGGVALVGGLLINNTVIRNSALQLGGNLYAGLNQDQNLSTFVANNVFWGSSVGYGVAVEGVSTEAWFVHNNVFDNTPGNFIDAITGMTADGFTGTQGNISDDPLFLNLEDEDYHLSDDSPCIDSGTSLVEMALGSTDLDGRMRHYGLSVDMGAYENAVCSAPVANAGPDQTCLLGETVQLSGDNSVICNPNERILFVWDQSSGLSTLLDDPLTSNPTFTPTAIGDYVFELILFNGDQLSRPDRVTIHVIQR